MRNVCSINLINIEASGSLISATENNELILKIIPLVTQLDGFKIEITKSSGGIITENVTVDKNYINYSVPFAYYTSAGTMKIRLLSNQGNSEYIDFNISTDLSSTNSVQVKWDSSNILFEISQTKEEVYDTGWLEIIGTDLAKNIAKPTAGEPVKYRRKNGIVYIYGTFKILDAPSDTGYTLFDLPEGFQNDLGGNFYSVNTATGARMSRYLIRETTVALEWVRDLTTGAVTTGNIAWAGIDVSFPCK